MILCVLRFVFAGDKHLYFILLFYTENGVGSWKPSFLFLQSELQASADLATQSINNHNTDPICTGQYVVCKMLAICPAFMWQKLFVSRSIAEREVKFSRRLLINNSA